MFLPLKVTRLFSTQQVSPRPCGTYLPVYLPTYFAVFYVPLVWWTGLVVDTLALLYFTYAERLMQEAKLNEKVKKSRRVQ